jgi:hypothetical protein
VPIRFEITIVAGDHVAALGGLDIGCNGEQAVETTHDVVSVFNPSRVLAEANDT